MPLVIGSHLVSSSESRHLNMLLQWVTNLHSIDKLDPETFPVKSEQACLGLPEEMLVVEKKAAGAVEYVGTIDADEGVICYFTTEEDAILLHVTREGFEKQLEEVFSRLKSTQKIQVKLASCHFTPKTRNYLKEILKVLHRLSEQYFIEIVAQQLNNQLPCIAFSLQSGALVAIDPILTIKNKLYRQVVPLNHLLKLALPQLSEEDSISDLLALVCSLASHLNPKLFRTIILFVTFSQIMDQSQSEQFEPYIPAEYLLRSIGDYGYENDLPAFHPNFVKVCLVLGSLLHSGEIDISGFSALEEPVAKFLDVTEEEMDEHFAQLVQFVQSPRNYQYVVGIFLKKFTAALESAHALVAGKQFEQAIAVLEEVLSEFDVGDIKDGFTALLCCLETQKQNAVLVNTCIGSYLKIAQCYFSLYEKDKAGSGLLFLAQDAAEKTRRIVKELRPDDQQQLAAIEQFLEKIVATQLMVQALEQENTAVAEAKRLLQSGQAALATQTYDATLKALPLLQQAVHIYEQCSSKKEEYLLQLAESQGELARCFYKLNLNMSTQDKEAAADKVAQSQVVAGQAIANYLAAARRIFVLYQESALRVQRETVEASTRNAYSVANNYLSGQEKEAAIKQIGLFVLQQGRDLYQKQKFERALPFFIQAASYLEQCTDEDVMELGKSYFNIAACNYNYGFFVAKKADEQLNYYTLAVDYVNKAAQLLVPLLPIDHPTAKLVEEKQAEFCAKQREAQDAVAAACRAGTNDDAGAAAPPPTALQC